MFRVVSLRSKPWPDWFVYVGREWAGLKASELGNPFKGPDAVKKYREWLDRHPDLDRLLWEVLGDSDGGVHPIACWCGFWKPGDPVIECHAVVVAQFMIARYGRSIREVPT